MKLNCFKRLILFILTGFMTFSCVKHSEESRSSIDLTGYWKFALDSNDIGIDQNWFLKELSDSVQMPGTTDISKKGHRNTDTTTMPGIEKRLLFRKNGRIIGYSL
jgi:hypothetical protein